MAEIVQWAPAGLKVVLAGILALTPGLLFFLGVVGTIWTVGRFSRGGGGKDTVCRGGT